MYRRKVRKKYEFQDVVLSEFLVGIMSKQEAMKGLRERMREEEYDIEYREKILKYLERKRIWKELETSVLLKEYYLVIGQR
jgi:hypothetical protein